MNDINKTIVYKIFIRFLKEKNMFSTFKSIANNKYHLNLNNRLLNIDYITLKSFTLPLEVTLNNDNANNFNRFCENVNNSREFNKIIFLFLMNKFKEFLLKQRILDKFLYNLYHYNYEISSWANKNGIYEKQIKKHKDEIINRYFVYLSSHNYTIMNSIDRAFSWVMSNETRDFWLITNNKFIKYIKSELLAYHMVTNTSIFKKILSFFKK